MLDWEQMVRRLAAAKPRHAPGAAHGYHALTYGWLVGELVRRVAGMKPICELFASEIAAPLALDGLYCGVPIDHQHRCAQLFSGLFAAPAEKRRANTDRLIARAQRWRRRLSVGRRALGPDRGARGALPPRMEQLDFDSEAFRSASIPLRTGMFTARSLARLYACLAAGGELDGVRLLSARRASARPPSRTAASVRVIPLSMRWRLGYHRAFALGARSPRGVRSLRLRRLGRVRRPEARARRRPHREQRRRIAARRSADRADRRCRAALRRPTCHAPGSDARRLRRDDR
jgi:CubicO group peptidase (beta-lactamase class C family)